VVPNSLVGPFAIMVAGTRDGHSLCNGAGFAPTSLQNTYIYEVENWAMRQHIGCVVIQTGDERQMMCAV
jgi:hypothetical protein